MFNIHDKPECKRYEKEYKYICVTESLCSMPETNIILQINYSSMFLKNRQRKKILPSLYCLGETNAKMFWRPLSQI